MPTSVKKPNLILLAAFVCGIFAAPTLTRAQALAHDKEKVEWVKQNMVPIRSINPDDDEDFSDLMPLKDLIGNSRIVQLGEISHGSGDAFQAKARLVKFLHQEMGFDVIAWESGMYDVKEVEAALHTDVPLYKAAELGIYRAWAHSNEAMPAFQYIRDSYATTRPLKLVGYDSRISEAKNRENDFAEYIFSFFDKVDPQLLMQIERFEFKRMVKGLLPGDYYRNPNRLRNFDLDVPKKLIEYIDNNEELIRKYHSQSEIEFVRHNLVNTIHFEKAMRITTERVQKGEDFEGESYTRDTVMGENLIWLATQRFPKSKIIVWAHNWHIMENVYTTDPLIDECRQDPGLGPAGRFINDHLGEDVYTICFLGYEGSQAYVHSENNVEELPKADANTLDALLHQANQPYGILDFRHLPKDHWLRQTNIARFYFGNPTPANWTRVMDAAFFVDKPYPVTTIEETKGQ